MKKYDVIYADPPWAFRCWSKKGAAKRSAASHYDTMTMEELIALRPTIDDISAENCALFMWGTWPTMPDVMRLIDAWGFKYITCGFLWAKLTKRWEEKLTDRHFVVDRLFHFGMGYYTRANTEFCLLARRGKLGRFDDKSIRQLVIEPIREHSRKPDKVRSLIERAYPNANKIEMFARTRAEGWDVWGNETDKF